MEFTQNRTSRTTLDLFQLLKVRLELNTGKKIRYFKSDNGSEFKGEFSDYLRTEGITHLLGEPYRKHIPPSAERAHRTILNRGRANHIGSNLPMSYYNESQLFSVYIFNRMIHSGATKSPYELIYNKTPDFDKIKPFGCIGYATIPLEQRPGEAKPNTPGRKCRLLGFGDEEGTVNRMGLKVLFEDDLTISYTVNVRWDEDA